LTDIVAGHVRLEIEGFDRIYLNGYVPALQLGGQLAGFLVTVHRSEALSSAVGQRCQETPRTL
jgi:hypothetical protein